MKNIKRVFLYLGMSSCVSTKTTEPPSIQTLEKALNTVQSPVWETAGSKEEAYFDSKPWLESDDEQDFLSVNGAQDMEALTNIKKILILFELTSGLQINFHKSELLGINTSQFWLQEAAAKLHCKVGSFPIVYLGLPIGGTISRISLWDPLIEKMKKKLVSWKGKLLSIGGRITLLKASLSNLPIYYMSLYPLPQGVIDKIIKIQRNFIWSGGMDKRSLALVRWELLQLPKSLGGLNVSNLFFRNLGLLCKWLWRFFDEPKALWRQIIESKYNLQSTHNMADIQKSKKGGPWRFLCNHLLKQQGFHEILQKGARKSIGNGKNTYFWQDRWLTNYPLKRAFPRLFRLSPNPMARVASMGCWVNNAWIWQPAWIRPLRPRHQAEWESLSKELQVVELKQEMDDTLRWTFSKSGSFSVKSCYEVLFKSSEPCLKNVIPKIWAGLAPPRVEIFIWLSIMERINTKKKLALLNIIPISDIGCTFCKSWPEDTAHLFLHCPFAMQLWSWWWNLWNISWVWPASLKLALEQWDFPGRNKTFKKFWLVAFQAIIWSLWKERNERVFNNKACSLNDLQSLVLVRICWWSKAWKDSFPYSTDEVLRHPQCLQWGSSPQSSLRLTQNRPQEDCISTLSWSVGISGNYFHGGIYQGFLENEKGKTICLFSCPFPPMNPIAATVLAIHRAIQISLNHCTFKNRPTVISSDSILALQWCGSPSKGPPHLSFILNFIQSAHNKGFPLMLSHSQGCSQKVRSILSQNNISKYADVVIWREP